MAADNNPMVLVINPGSTSTKVAIYSGDTLIAQDTIRHKDEELSRFNSLWNQFDFRVENIEEF